MLPILVKYGYIKKIHLRNVQINFTLNMLIGCNFMYSMCCFCERNLLIKVFVFILFVEIRNSVTMQRFRNITNLSEKREQDQ